MRNRVGAVGEGGLELLWPVGSAIHLEDDANGPLIILWAEARHQLRSSMLSPDA